jgi:hypothetical protein
MLKFVNNLKNFDIKEKYEKCYNNLYKDGSE